MSAPRGPRPITRATRLAREAKAHAEGAVIALDAVIAELEARDASSDTADEGRIEGRKRPTKPRNPQGSTRGANTGKTMPR